MKLKKTRKNPASTCYGKCNAKMADGREVVLHVEIRLDSLIAPAKFQDDIQCTISVKILTKGGNLVFQSEYSNLVGCDEDIRAFASSVFGINIDYSENATQVLTGVLGSVATKDYLVTDEYQDKYAVIARTNPDTIEL